MAAEITAGFLGPALEVVKWVSAPILRQFKYLCCFTTNITNLKNEAQKLQDAERDLQERVNAETTRLQLITREVEAWLRDSKNIINEEDVITKQVPNVGSGCLKLRARFSLSKRAVKTADRLKELRDKCKFDIISRPRPPAATEAFPIERTCEFESRKQIEEDIMATLRGKDVKMMGICGMGGLGKTTMAKRIMNRALEEHVFQEVVMAVVSRPIDKLKIQLEIGGSLGLKLEGESLQARVQKLHERLSGTKRTLVILDDVWERFRLEDLGIPRGYEGCTILLTSRNRDVLNAMNVEKIFGMEVLSKEDSWLLFRMEAGQCVDDTRLNSIAKEVVRECAGLPIVLITVGAALKGEEHLYIWENALQRLKINCTPDIPEYIAEVYNPLKLSYDVLERNYQDVFLLCCLYPEDADIPLEQLTYFCMGLRIATGNVEEARNRIRALTKVLKNRSLLLDSEKGDEYLRMHDVVRDVCIFIAKQEGYIGDNDLTSSLQRYKLHSGFELLQIRNSDEEINFDGITNLYVLSIESCRRLRSLPFTQRPNNLITLVLDSCRKLEEICDDRISSNSFQNLKILKLDHLPVLKQFWKSSQNDFLPQLEVLEIGRCGMMETVFLWKGEDGNENTSCHHITKIFPKLKELRLEYLPNLISLCQGIESIEFPLLKRIRIEYCKKMKGMVWNENNSGGSSSKASIQGLFCPEEVSFAELEELKIFGCQSILSLFTSSMAGNLVNLKKLWIEDCDEMVEVIKDDEEKGMSGGRQTALQFPKLEIIVLWNLPKLVSFCESKGIESIQFPVLRSVGITRCEKMKGMVANGVTSNENNSAGDSSNAADIIHLFCQSKQVSFGCLKELVCGGNPFCSHTIHVSIFDRLEELIIYECKGSMSLFSSSITGNLVNLTRLYICDCEKMVKVIEEKEKVVSGAQRTTILFPKLHKIVLLYLPELVRFCEWKCDVELPSLTEVEINGSHNMKSFTLGPLNTPKLEMVKIEDEEFGDVKDLNGLVQQQYLRRAEETTDVATQKEAPAAAAK